MDTKTEICIFCENVRRLRKRARLSKRKMCKILGIGMGSLNLIESGILPERLNCEVVFKIQRYFGLTSYELFAEIIEVEE